MWYKQIGQLFQNPLSVDFYIKLSDILTWWDIFFLKDSSHLPFDFSFFPNIDTGVVQHDGMVYPGCIRLAI